MADFHVFSDPEDLSLAAARLFIERAHRALSRRGRFTVALSGGSTPRRLFQLLAEPAQARAVPWDRTLILWGDDRAVPPDHEHSNYRLARENLLDNISIPEENVLRIRGELGATEAAEDMRRNLVNVFGDVDYPRFDLALQGMGSDGHTASLFPGTAALDDEGWVAAVPDPPADPKIDRVTLTFPVLNAARTALFLVTGGGKRALVSEIMNDPTAGQRYPAARVDAQDTVWFLDRAAFPSEA